MDFQTRIQEPYAVHLMLRIIIVFVHKIQELHQKVINNYISKSAMK